MDSILRVPESNTVLSSVFYDRYGLIQNPCSKTLSIKVLVKESSAID